MRYTGPKNKIARREGIDLELKTPGSKAQANLLKRLNILPGQHGVKRRRKMTDHGFQLREKQKLRQLFGLTEKQLKRYYKKAVKRKGNTGFFMSQFLEKRLDNIVYRLGFAPTRAAARQLVSHKHIKVNDKVVNIPSYQVSVDDMITFNKKKTVKVPYIEKSLANKDLIIPKYLKRKGLVGKLVSEPDSEKIENQINLKLVIEYYSR